MIYKNDFPELEYDSDTRSVVKLKLQGIELPKKAIFAFTGDDTDSFARAENARIATVLETITRNYNIYIINKNGEDICLMQAPMGAPAAVQNLEVLLSLGVKTVIATGSCGVLSDIPENRFIVPVRALRSEGTSYQYAPASRYFDLDADMISKVCGRLDSMEIPYQKCTTWTTDCFVRETPEMVEYRRKEGCEVVDMECSALAACARLRGAKFAQIFFTADSLADVKNYDRREFGESSRGKALAVCLDVISGLE